jgi:hypothetical protein
MQINISNNRGHDALVNTKSVTRTSRTRWIDKNRRQAEIKKILKSTIGHDLDALVEQAGSLEQVADLLIHGDPEIDVETYGSFLTNTTRAYNQDRKIVNKIIQWDVVKNPDGIEMERRVRKQEMPNVAEVPLKWSGKLMKKEKIFNRFIFSAKMQIVHFNGLTYDFLFNMAKDLEEKDSVMMVGAGPKANQPLIFRRGGTPYRGFLEGRTQGDKYTLILHLSNMELKGGNHEHN